MIDEQGRNGKMFAEFGEADQEKFNGSNAA